MANIPKYTVEVRDQYGRLVTILNNPMKKQIDLYRNKPGACQFVLDAFDSQATNNILQLNVYDIVMRRGGTVIFAGRLSYIYPQVDETDKAEVDCTATGYVDLFQQRLVTSSYANFDTTHNQLVYSEIDGGQVIASLINETQFPTGTDAGVLMQNTTPTMNQSFIASGSTTVNQIRLLLKTNTDYSGTATSGTSNTLTDTNQSWSVNQFAGGLVNITGGTDVGDNQIIASNTSNTLTLYSANSFVTGTVTNPTTGATANTLTDTGQAWTVNAYVGRLVSITAGTGIAQSAVILSNTSNTLTLSSYWTTNLDTTSQYSIAITPFTGKTTSSSANSITDSNQSWLTNMLTGSIVIITTGTDAQDSQTIISNTSTSFTTAGNFKVTPDATSTYNILPAPTGTFTVIPDTSSTYTIIPSTSPVTGNVSVGIYPDNGGVPDVTPIANSTITIPASQVSFSQYGWATFQYSGTLPQLTQGNVYWIKANLSAGQSGNNGILWGYLNNDYYPAGHAYSPENPTLFSSDQDLQFFILMSDNSYQQTKNTYLGISQGALESSYNITYTIPAYKPVKEAIEEISQLKSGIDFSINVSIDSNNLMTRIFNVYYPVQGINNTALNFTYPGNIIKFSRARDGKSMMNVLYTRGQGTGQTQPVTTSFNGNSIQQFGLFEATEDYSDIQDVPTLQSLGDENIRVQNNPLDTPDFTIEGNDQPQIGSFGLGDTILLKSSGPGLLNFTATYRIEEIHVLIDEDDKETIELVVSIA